MPRKPRTYRDLPQEVMGFVADFANKPLANGYSLDTKPTNGPHARRFRQRIYAWRRAVTDLLIQPESPETQRAVDWLTATIGPRAAHKDWHDCVTYHVLPAPDAPGAWICRGSFEPPAYGEYNDPLASASTDTKAMLAAALARNPTAIIARGGTSTMPQPPVERGTFDFNEASPAERLAHARRIADGTTDER